MDLFLISHQLEEQQLIFMINATFNNQYRLTCRLSRNILDSQYLSIQHLNQLLLKNVAKMQFSIEDLQLQIVIPICKATRMLYLSIEPPTIQILQQYYKQTIQYLQISIKQISTSREKELQGLNQQIAEKEVKCKEHCWSQRSIKDQSQRLQQQVINLNKEIVRLSRQVFLVDQQIIASKRGLQLEQYRLETSSEDRVQRRRKVYINQLNKFSNPKIQKMLKESPNLQRVELPQCQLKSMRFVEIFPQLQQIRLPKNSIRKIQGLTTLTQLRKLYLQHNNIQKLEGFNNNLELRELGFPYNRISRLENIFHLIRLQILSLSQNIIEQIPKEVKMMEGLIQLRIINNIINVLPWELLSLNRLRTVSILGNPCFRANHKCKQLISKLVEGQIQTCCSNF